MTDETRFDFNVWNEDGLDEWTEDVIHARFLAVRYRAKTGTPAHITKYPIRETEDGWQTDTLAGGEVVA